ncbi:glycosyl transferase [Microbacterium sp. bgisy189]|uniref:glycosyl transferase n=1 Tax=Microbacterium sp. bgisy189 TaxID=3413798 RepID=UPI003EBA3DAB
MRFVWAVAAFVLATLMIGAGIAQRTVLQGPESESQSIEIDESVPYILIDGAVLNSHDGAQTLRARGDGTIFAAYGRTADMTAWLGTSDYVSVTVSDAGTIRSEVVTAPEPETDATAEEAAAEAAPLDPHGSDLWLDEFEHDRTLITSLELPDDVSLLIAADGVEPAPTDLSLSWPTGVTTPWAGPLIVGGALMMAAGIVLYILGVRHVRRSRGPRRKGLPMAHTEPIDLAVEGADKGVISATPARRQITRGRKKLLAVPTLGLSALLFAGCSADAWPQFGSTPTPTPSQSVIVPEGQGAPAVTKAQAERIIARIAQTVTEADEAADLDLASTRLASAALAVRKTNYAIREELDDHPALAPIPTEGLQILLPEAFDGWPRTFLAVMESSDDKSTVIMAVTQDDAWSDYKLRYMGNMSGDTELNVAPDYVGALTVAPDSPFLVLPPQELAGAYADVIDEGDDSVYAGLFDLEADTLRAQITADRADRLEQFNETGEETGTLSYDAVDGNIEAVSLGTVDSGAIVAVTIRENETVEATDDDAVIKLRDEDDDEDTGNRIVEALTDTTSAKGYTTTYLDQLFFFVPAQSSNESIRLLGYSSDILGAKEIEE